MNIERKANDQKSDKEELFFSQISHQDAFARHNTSDQKTVNEIEALSSAGVDEILKYLISSENVDEQKLLPYFDAIWAYRKNLYFPLYKENIEKSVNTVKEAYYSEKCTDTLKTYYRKAGFLFAQEDEDPGSCPHLKEDSKSSHLEESEVKNLASEVQGRSDISEEVIKKIASLRKGELTRVIRVLEKSQLKGSRDLYKYLVNLEICFSNYFREEYQKMFAKYYNAIYKIIGNYDSIWQDYCQRIGFISNENFQETQEAISRKMDGEVLWQFKNISEKELARVLGVLKKSQLEDAEQLLRDLEDIYDYLENPSKKRRQERAKDAYSAFEERYKEYDAVWQDYCQRIEFPFAHRE